LSGLGLILIIGLMLELELLDFNVGRSAILVLRVLDLLCLFIGRSLN